MLFVLLLLFLLFLDAAALLSGQFELIPHLLWLKLIPLALAGCALLRLFRSQRAFSKARASLSFVLKGEKRADAALYRMTDEEIVLCSKLEQEELKGWMKSKSSLRWRLIQEACRP